MKKLNSKKAILLYLISSYIISVIIITFRKLKGIDVDNAMIASFFVLAVILFLAFFYKIKNKATLPKSS